MKYNLKEVHPNIFAVIVPNSRMRALLFLRAQEYYESSIPKFYRKTFDMQEYNKVDSIDKYIKRWAGFNFPYKIAKRCYDELSLHPELITKYDKIFYKILAWAEKRKSVGRAYIIGVGDIDTYKHELSQALYYTNTKYRNIVHKLEDSIPRAIYKQLSRNIKAMGYDEDVVKDEMQAYIVSNDWDSVELRKGISKKTMEMLHIMFNYYLLKFIVA